MIRPPGFLRQVRSCWRSAWPCWALLIFAGLDAVRLLPGGNARATVAAPILFMVPGSLTLGAAFSERRPRGAVFVCYAALLSALWSAFASIALYVIKVLITADSTYCCLLIVSAVLAIVAQARLVLARPPVGRRAARKHVAVHPDLPDAEAGDLESPAPAGRTRYYINAAVVAGLSLLAGGVYALDNLPHPAPAGYTWMAWTGAPIKGAVSIGSAGTRLPFQIFHRQSDTTAFQLEAAWLGKPSRLLAGPMTLNIGPNRTIRGALFVPRLPDGCTYRIVVTLTARQMDPLTKKQQQWSINADVHESGYPAEACKR